LIGPILILLFSGNRMGALALFLVACAGDVLDGLVARARKEITTWGKVLDPTVDKALYLSVLSGLAVRGDLPILTLILFLIPQVGLGIGALILHLRARKVQGARILGKAASVLTFIAILFFIAAWPGRIPLLYAAIGATYIAGADYLLAARSLHGISP
jgi:phosphatidylglycerophosphate synthase